MEGKYNHYAPSVMRLVLGLLFIIPGFQKLANPEMIIGMLGNLGFPWPAVFGWILLLSEIVFGASVLMGLKVNYTVWPLMLILGVANITVHIPAWMNAEPMALISVLLHLLAMASLLSIYFTGSGAFAVKKINIVFSEVPKRQSVEAIVPQPVPEAEST